MTSPFTTQRGLQRSVSIPVTPTRHSTTTVTAVSHAELNALNIAVALQTFGSVRCYCYFAAANPEVTAALSSATLQFNFVTLNAGVVTSQTLIYAGSVACGAAGAGIDALPPYAPSVPGHFNIAIPAGSTQIALQVNVSAIGGAPSVRCEADWGIDNTNQAAPGDIGGGQTAAQSAGNPNAF